MKASNIVILSAFALSVYETGLARVSNTVDEPVFSPSSPMFCAEAAESQQQQGDPQKKPVEEEPDCE